MVSNVFLLYSLALCDSQTIKIQLTNVLQLFFSSYSVRCSPQAKSPGLSPSPAELSLSPPRGPGTRFEWAQAPISQARARVFEPSPAWHITTSLFYPAQRVGLSVPLQPVKQDKEVQQIVSDPLADIMRRYPTYHPSSHQGKPPLQIGKQYT